MVYVPKPRVLIGPLPTPRICILIESRLKRYLDGIETHRELISRAIQGTPCLISADITKFDIQVESRV